jgi:DNA-directed RNA polymerase specialized sigma24 family protein
VQLRRLGLTEEQAMAAKRLYLDGLTLVEIAVRFGVAASTIRSCLLRRGVPMRPAARRRTA